jgi:hypothetical protein
VLNHSLNFAQSFFRFYHNAQSFCVFISDVVISSVILCFPLSFCEAQRRRRQGRRWERRWEEEAGALTDGGAARGVAGRDTHRQGRRGVKEAGARCRAV